MSFLADLFSIIFIMLIGRMFTRHIMDNLIKS